MMPVTCSSVGRQARLPVRRRGSLTHGNRTHPRFPNTRPIANATESLREVQSNWTTTDSAEVYGFETWGAPYVTTDASTGRVVITPRGDDEFRGDDNNIDNNEHNESITIDLFALASDVRARLGSGGPLVVRFTDIALRQASKLHGIFSNATGTWNYGSRYQGVFPVKCCHDAELLTALVMDGFRNKSGFGLEAGSKAELLLAIAVMTRVRKETTHQVMLLPETNTEVSLGRKKENKFGKHEQTPDPLLICNGYKDEKYVRLAFAAAASGVTTVLVLEKPSELETVMQVMRTSDDDTETTRTTPALGIRVRLGTTHDGQWGATSGDDAKFGLGAFEVLQAVSVLKKNDLLHKLTLLHFHVGSQVSDIATIKEAMREASQMYAELCRLGAPMGFIDVGGGLGVDYDGTKGGSGLGGGSSVNYDFSNYANDVVAALQDVVVRTGITPPVIVSESGRAVVSHSTVLVFEVVSTDNRGGTVETREGGGVFDDLSSFDLDRDGTDENALETAKNPKPLTLDELRVLPPSEFLLHNFREVLNGLRRENFLHATRGDDGLGNNTHKGLGNNPQKPNLQEAINDSKQFRLEADRLFKLGIMGLENRAEAEFLFSKCRARVFDIAKHEHNKNETRFLDLRSLQKQPSKWYHANVSVFRSLPDVWAIGQLFPVAPIHRLREEPTTNAAFADLTCDSDGRIDEFVAAGNLATNRTSSQRASQSSVSQSQSHSAHKHSSSFLTLHHPMADEPYLIGAFLVGAYQESMGSVGHNLFGSPAVVSVTTIDNGGRGVTVTKETRDEKEKGVEGVGDESSTQTTDTTTPRGNRSSQITFQTCGDRVSVTVTRGDTNADALRDAGIDPVELSAWVAGDVANTTTDERNEKKHVSLAQTYEDVLTSSTYLER